MTNVTARHRADGSINRRSVTGITRRLVLERHLPFPVPSWADPHEYILSYYGFRL